MITILFAAQIAFLIQVTHSIEELVTGFHKKWYLFKMPFFVFFLFEIGFTFFWFLVIFTSYFSNEKLLLFYILLMFANAIQHLVWFGINKKYVPGLVTALFHLSWSIISLISIY